MNGEPRSSPFEERRASERIRARLRIRYGVSVLDRVDFASDISEGGLHLATNDIFKIGTRFRLALELDDYRVQLEAEVMWAIRVPAHLVDSLSHGMGVRFVHPPPDWSRRFRRWKEAHGDSAA